MNRILRIVGFSFVGLAVAGLSTPLFAGGLLPGNGGTINLPLSLPPPSRNTLSSSNDYSGFDEFGHRFGVRDGRLDFFSLLPDNSGGFKPLLRGGVGDGGVQLQLKW
jgi:hypothetical protein